VAQSPDEYKLVNNRDLAGIRSELIQARTKNTQKYNQLREDYTSEISIGLEKIELLEKTKRKKLDSLSVLKTPIEMEFEKYKNLYSNYEILRSTVENFNAFLSENKVLNDLTSFLGLCNQSPYYSNLVSCYLGQGGAIAFLVSEPKQIKKLSKILEENITNQLIVFAYEDVKSKKNAFYLVNVDTMDVSKFKITSFYEWKDGREIQKFKSNEQKEDLYRFIKNYNDENQMVYKSHGIPHLKALDDDNLIKITANNKIIDLNRQLEYYTLELNKVNKKYSNLIHEIRWGLNDYDLEKLKNRRNSDSLGIAHEIIFYEEEYPIYEKCWEIVNHLSSLNESESQELYLKNVYDDFSTVLFDFDAEMRKSLNENFNKSIIFENLLLKLHEVSSSPYTTKAKFQHVRLIPIDGFSVYLKGFDIANRFLESKKIDGLDKNEIPNGVYDLDILVDGSGKIKNIENKSFSIRCDWVFQATGDFLYFRNAEKMKIFRKLDSDLYKKLGEFNVALGLNNTRKQILENYDIALSYFEQADYEGVIELACRCGIYCNDFENIKFEAKYGKIYSHFWNEYPQEVVQYFYELYQRSHLLQGDVFSSNSSKSKKSFCYVDFNGDKYEIKLLGDDGGKVVYNLYKQGALIKTVTGSWDEKFVGFGDATKIVISLDGINQRMEFLLRKYSNGAWQDLQEMEGMQRTWSICLP
jgi:hypothetical protein